MQPADTDDTIWLTDEQQQAWRALIAVVLRLPGALEQQLQADAGLTHFEYFVLALLSEVPHETLRLGQLATAANASLSRLSHVASRLEKRGLLHKMPCPDDPRATLARLTDDGRATVVRHAPGHVAHVRQLVFHGLPTADVTSLERICNHVIAHLT